MKWKNVTFYHLIKIPWWLAYVNKFSILGLIRDGLFTNWKFVFVFHPGLHDIQLLVPLLFHFVFYFFYGELIPSPLPNQTSLPPLKYPSPPFHSNVFEINKTARVGFKRGFTVYKAVFTLWVFYSDFSYLPVRCKSSCQVHHHTYPSHIHLALNKMTWTAHHRTHLSINIQYTLLFIQNISPFLIGSYPPANSS